MGGGRDIELPRLSQQLLLDSLWNTLSECLQVTNYYYNSRGVNIDHRFIFVLLKTGVGRYSGSSRRFGSPTSRRSILSCTCSTDE